MSAGHGLGEAAGWGPWLLPAALGWASGQFLSCLVVWLQTDIYSENQPNRKDLGCSVSLLLSPL